MEESAAKATGLARPAGTRVVLGDLTAGWQRCRRVAGGPAGANEHGELLTSVAGTPPDAGLVVAVSLRRRWSAQVSHGNRHLTGIGSRQQTVSGCLQQQQRRRSRQPPAAAGEAGDATSQPVRACHATEHLLSTQGSTGALGRVQLRPQDSQGRQAHVSCRAT